MADKEKIKEEIEQLYKHYLDAQEFDSGYNRALDDILKFIDSLPEEHNENLEEEIDRCYKSRIGLMMTRKQFGELIHHFTKWQKKKDQETIELAEDHAMLAGMMQEQEEMMKNAVEGLVGGHTDIPAFINLEIEHKPNIKVGDKVKIIILKTE